MKNILRVLFKFYSFVYFFISGATFLACVLALATCFTASESKEIILKFGVGPAIAGLMDSVIWCAWGFTFNKLNASLKVMAYGVGFKDSFVKIYKLLLAVFFVELIRFIYGCIFPARIVDWNSVVVPSDAESLSLRIFHWFQYFLKLSHMYGDFLTPSVSGLSALVIAMFLYVIVVNTKAVDR